MEVISEDELHWLTGRFWCTVEVFVSGSHGENDTVLVTGTPRSRDAARRTAPRVRAGNGVNLRRTEEGAT